jgi:hypothetical protein
VLPVSGIQFRLLPENKNRLLNASLPIDVSRIRVEITSLARAGVCKKQNEVDNMNMFDISFDCDFVSARYVSFQQGCKNSSMCYDLEPNFIVVKTRVSSLQFPVLVVKRTQDLKNKTRDLEGCRSIQAELRALCNMLTFSGLELPECIIYLTIERIKKLKILLGGSGTL